METIKLNTGSMLPSVGLGFWKIPQEKTAAVAVDAIRAGYRHFDCACDYGNEVQVGQGIADALNSELCTREDLWVTSKLWNTYHAAEHVRPAAERSLRDLQLDYFDLYLIHFPIALKFVPFEERYPPEWTFDPTADTPKMEFAPVPISETWQAMEFLVDDGLAKNIGICNFGTTMLRDLLTYARIRPAVLQIESHPLLTQEKLIRFCHDHDIAVTAFSPLGSLSYVELSMADNSDSLLQHSEITRIAGSHGRTAAQVLLRWGLQRGTSIVPKTSSSERLRENIDIFNFELSADEMQAISSLDQHRRFNDPGDFGEAAFNTFCPIYD